MRNPFPLASALSVTLHFVVVASAMLLTKAEEVRSVVAMDVVWMGAESVSMSPSEPAGEPAATEAMNTLLAHPSRRDFDPGETAPQDEVLPQEAPHREGPIAARAANGVSKNGPPAPAKVQRRERPAARETIETAASPSRRQVVAKRAADSRGSDSFRASSAPDLTASASATDRSDQESRPTGADLARSADSASSAAMAESREIVYRVAPVYPVAARRRGIEGAVLLHVRFDIEGRPEDVSIMTSSGSAMLDDAAREAVARWRFRGGRPGALELPITFRLVAASAVDGAVSIAHQGVKP